MAINTTTGISDTLQACAVLQWLVSMDSLVLRLQSTTDHFPQQSSTCEATARLAHHRRPAMLLTSRHFPVPRRPLPSPAATPPLPLHPLRWALPSTFSPYPVGPPATRGGVVFHHSLRRSVLQRRKGHAPGRRSLIHVITSSPVERAPTPGLREPEPRPFTGGGCSVAAIAVAAATTAAAAAAVVATAVADPSPLALNCARTLRP